MVIMPGFIANNNIVLGLTTFHCHTPRLNMCVHKIDGIKIIE
jgi:hypothetical protein